MKLVTLVENSTGRSGLKAQHGLSLWIVSGGSSFLFDSGKDNVFFENASKMGIDVREANFAVLSHGHYDHGGGLDTFLSLNQYAPVYLGINAEGNFFTRFILHYRFIGINQSVCTRFKNRFIRVDADRQIAPGIYLLTPIGRHEAVPKGNRRLFMKSGDRFEPDTFIHEILLVIDEGDGIVIVTGCGHSGILNLVNTAQERFPGKPVKAVVGGFHLIDNPYLGTMGADPEGVRFIGKKLASLGCRVITGHCTGKKAARLLKTELGGRMETLSTGYSTEI